MSFVILDVDFTQLRDALGRFASVERDLGDVVPDVVMSASKMTVKALQARAPRNRWPQPGGPRPGSRVAANIKLDDVVGKGSWWQGVITLPEAAQYTRPPGTAPHTIRARNAKTLLFYWHRVDAFMSIPEVYHPGYIVPRADDWVQLALDDVTPAVDAELRRAGKIRLSQFSEV